MKEHCTTITEPPQQSADHMKSATAGTHPSHPAPAASRQPLSKASANAEKSTPDMIALRLTVYNHPGVMSHVCGLFARRAFNVESIFVVPINNSDTSRIWLLVHDDDRLDQMIRQTRKLHDVIDITVSRDARDIFQRFTTFMEIWESTDPQIAGRR